MFILPLNSGNIKGCVLLGRSPGDQIAGGNCDDGSPLYLQFHRIVIRRKIMVFIKGFPHGNLRIGTVGEVHFDVKGNQVVFTAAACHIHRYLRLTQCIIRRIRCDRYGAVGGDADALAGLHSGIVGLLYSISFEPS